MLPDAAYLLPDAASLLPKTARLHPNGAYGGPGAAFYSPGPVGYTLGMDTPPRLPLHDDVPADQAAIQFFRPQKPSGAAVVVLPGGGYGGLADHEGAPVARWLNTLGITAAVCYYRHAGTNGGKDAVKNRWPTPWVDATRAVRRVRAGVDKLGVDHGRVGILGFSAGGHLAATVSTIYDAGKPDAADPVERVSSRPDLAVLCYPVITMTDPRAHAGSRQNLLGDRPPRALVEKLSPERHVTDKTPATFLYSTADDPVVPVQNALMYATALADHKVPFELHAYAHGPHGTGLAAGDPILRTWTDRCADWLKGRGFA